MASRQVQPQGDQTMKPKQHNLGMHVSQSRRCQRGGPGKGSRRAHREAAVSAGGWLKWVAPAADRRMENVRSTYAALLIHCLQPRRLSRTDNEKEMLLKGCAEGKTRGTRDRRETHRKAEVSAGGRLRGVAPAADGSGRGVCCTYAAVLVHRLRPRLVRCADNGRAEAWPAEVMHPVM
jgi:hypothetical protein